MAQRQHSPIAAGPTGVSLPGGQMYGQELQRASQRMSMKTALAELQQRQQALNMEATRLKLAMQKQDEQERARREIQAEKARREREAQRQLSEAEGGGGTTGKAKAAKKKGPSFVSPPSLKGTPESGNLLTRGPDSREFTEVAPDRWVNRGPTAGAVGGITTVAPAALLPTEEGRRLRRTAPAAGDGDGDGAGAPGAQSLLGAAGEPGAEMEWRRTKTLGPGTFEEELAPIPREPVWRRERQLGPGTFEEVYDPGVARQPTAAAPTSVAPPGVAGQPGQRGPGDQFFGAGSTPTTQPATGEVLLPRPIYAPSKVLVHEPSQRPSGAAEPFPPTPETPFRDPYSGVNAASELEGRKRFYRLMEKAGVPADETAKPVATAPTAEQELAARARLTSPVRITSPVPGAGVSSRRLGAGPSEPTTPHLPPSYPKLSPAEAASTARAGGLVLHGAEREALRPAQLPAVEGEKLPSGYITAKWPKKAESALTKAAQTLAGARKAHGAQMQRYRRLVNMQRTVPAGTSVAKVLPKRIAQAKEAAIGEFSTQWLGDYAAVVSAYQAGAGTRGAAARDRRVKAEGDLVKIFVAQRAAIDRAPAELRPALAAAAMGSLGDWQKALGPAPETTRYDLSTEAEAILTKEVQGLKEGEMIEAKSAEIVNNFLNRWAKAKGAAKAKAMDDLIAVRHILGRSDPMAVLVSLIAKLKTGKGEGEGEGEAGGVPPSGRPTLPPMTPE